ncbi:hypothetical protein DFQ27_002485 [Actinomortierella ambigua]|uniref:Uncharacterized protein n=1 Tax=Actinomortierella ambigua TaxID=1343610 RepID=A0A9P6U6Z3_9FUNG|nr:hypothetical protein DFQ27_002485 [Actinomortierella ambigua]
MQENIEKTLLPGFLDRRSRQTEQKSKFKRSSEDMDKSDGEEGDGQAVERSKDKEDVVVEDDS